MSFPVYLFYLEFNLNQFKLPRLLRFGFPSPITTLVDMLPPRDFLISIQPIIVPI